MKRKAVFLDRDGVIIRAVVRSGRPFPSTSGVMPEILPDVPEALARLHRAGFLLIVVTNQPDVARGVTPKCDVEAANTHLAAALPLTEVRVCYHDDDDGCECRKPRPGMLLSAARAHDIDLAGSFMVGDRWRDVEAGERAGCKTFFIDCGYDERQPERYDFRVASLAEAAKAILALSGAR